MVDWNEHAPDAIGLEFVPSTVEPLPVVRVDAPSYGAAASFESTATEYLEEIDVAVATDTDRGRFLLETFLAGDELIDSNDIEVERIDVNGAVGGGGSLVFDWGTQLGASSSAAFAAVLSDGDTSTYICPLRMQDRFLGITFATNAAVGGPLAGRRILDVTVKMLGGTQPVEVLSGAQLENVPASGAGGGVSRNLTVAFLQSGGFPIVGSLSQGRWNVYKTPFDLVPSLDQERSFSTGEIVPYGDLKTNRYPWTLADLAATEAESTAIYFGLEVAYSVDGKFTAVEGDILNVPFISEMWMEVTHCRENRLSADYQESYGQGPFWYFMFPTPPDGSPQYSGYQKNAGDDLTVLVRQPAFGDTAPTTATADARFSLPYIPGTNLPAGLQTFLRPGLNGDGTLSLMGDPSPAAVLPVNLNCCPPSPDAQPYGNILRRATDTGETFRQQVVTTTGATYSGVLLPCNLAVDGTGQPLVVNLRRTSDNALMATGSVTPTEALATPLTGLWRRVQVPFAAPVALAGGTGYYTEIPPVAGGAVWTFPVATQFIDTELYDDANTYGADVLSFEDGGNGQVLYADQPIVVYVEPETPANFTVTAEVEDPDPGDPFCGTGGIAYAQLEWDQPALGLFAYYEVQRLGPYDPEWQTIGRFTDSSVLAMKDREAARGAESEWRIRQVNVVGVGSEWATATAELDAGAPGLTFTTNVLPERGVGYADVYDPPRANKDYTFPSAAEVAYWPIYGRDDVVATRSSERRGPRFARRLLVSAVPAPSRPGVSMFEPLESLTMETLPYLCVRDQYGDVWYADVTVVTGQISEPGHFYYADIGVVQTARVPYPVDAVA